MEEEHSTLAQAVAFPIVVIGTIVLFLLRAGLVIGTFFVSMNVMHALYQLVTYGVWSEVGLTLTVPAFLVFGQGSIVSIVVSLALGPVVVVFLTLFVYALV